MFEDTKLLPHDPILGVSSAFRADQRSEKIDLGGGVYRTLDGQTPVMKAVAKAEAAVIAGQSSKVYTPVDGYPGFAPQIISLLLGADHPAGDRIAAVQTPGGCGALRVAGELIAGAGSKAITIGAPTWGNHFPLLSAAGNKINMTPYYDKSACSLDYDAFLEAVKKLGPDDTLLLHGGCHNPTGADLTRDQIDQIAAQLKFLPLIDMAYHGFANGLEDDAYIVRRFAEVAPELLVTYSCSKNFGLYRERIGALLIIGSSAEKTAALKSHAVSIARTMYSMPPAHGGAIVTEILQSPELSQLWRDELDEMAAAVKNNRALLVKTADEMGLGNRLAYIERQAGMFSLLPIEEAEAIKMREEHAVYVINDGRINLYGVNANNVEHFMTAVKTVMQS